MSDYSFGMKLFVWIAVITLVVTAVAPVFYYLVPQGGDIPETGLSDETVTDDSGIAELAEPNHAIGGQGAENVEGSDDYSE